MARQVGRYLATEGVFVYCGGRGGVMEAVCRGVEDNSGISVGILPGCHGDAANRHVTVSVASGAGDARNNMIANSVHGAIAIGGEYGTLSEIALTLRQDKPVVGLGTWDIKGVEKASSPKEAVSKILDLI